MALSVSFLFSAINVQTASKDELMCIKGIGDKKADAIIKYRKANKLKSVEDLINIKGLGKVLVQNVKNEIKSVACGAKKTTKKKSTSKKETSSKKISEKKKEDKKATLKKETTSKKTSETKKQDTQTDSKKAE